MARETEHSAFLSLSDKSLSRKGYHLFRGNTRINDEPYKTEKEAIEAYKNLKDSTNVKVQYSQW